MDYAREKTAMPGLAMIIFGVLMLLAGLVGAILQLVSSMASIIDAVSNGYGTEFWIPFLTGTGWQIIMSLVSMIASLIVVIAGTRLRAVRSAGFVYAGAIIAALPCCSSWCCCIGLPIAIWAIVTMQDEQVKSAFAE